MQHYGYPYDYERSKAENKIESVSPIPAILDRIRARLVSDGYFSRLPDQLIVNEYLPGQGIGFHTDNVKKFGPTVASLSLISPYIMDFTKKHKVFLFGVLCVFDSRALLCRIQTN